MTTTGPSTTPTRPEDILARAIELARDPASIDSIDEASRTLMTVADGDRRAVESARDQGAARVRARVDDFEATAGLQLLNRVLSHVPINDPLDWKVRWTQRFRRP